MYEQVNMDLQGWTAARLSELRQASAAARQLREAGQARPGAWWTRVANELGRALVATGTWLELLAKKELATR